MGQYQDNIGLLKGVVNTVPLQKILIPEWDTGKGLCLLACPVFNMFLKGFPSEAKTAPKNWN